MTILNQNNYLNKIINAYKKNLSIKTRKEIERFFFAFVAAWFFKTLLNEFPFFTQIFYISNVDIFLEEFTIRVSKNILEILGYEIYRDGIFMQIIGTYGVRLEFGCLAVRHLTLFIVFILAYIGKWYHKLWYIPSGILAIALINSLRIVILCIVQLKKPEAFHNVHDVLFPPIMSIITFILWIIWVIYFGKYKVKTQEK